MCFFTDLNAHEKKILHASHGTGKVNSKINTAPDLKFSLVKIFTSVIREAIYHVKAFYTYAFKSSSTRMALRFHTWPSLMSTQHTEVILSLLLPPATHPDSTAGRVVRGNAPGKNFTQCKLIRI